MADPVWQDNVTPLNAANMNKLQTRDEKAQASGYASLGADGKVPAAQLPTSPTSGHVIQEEGTPLTPRAALNFVGAGVTATDDAANDRTLVTVPGQISGELGYSQITANATVPVVVEASAATIITVAGVVCDGSALIVEFAAAAAAAGSGGQVLVNLWLDSADQGRIVQFTATSLTPLVARTRLTPAAGTHTFTARVWSSGGAAGTIYAGAGGAGVYRPAFLRVARA